MTVIWTKPDGVNEKASLSIPVTWYDLVMPDFKINFDLSQTLLTSEQDSLFFLEALNFAIDEIYNYEVAWSVTPEIVNAEALTVLSGGRIM